MQSYDILADYAKDSTLNVSMVNYRIYRLKGDPCYDILKIYPHITRTILCGGTGC